MVIAVSNIVEDVKNAYEADMNLFKATLSLLKDCIERNSLEEAMFVIETTALVIDCPRV